MKAGISRSHPANASFQRGVFGFAKCDHLFSHASASPQPYPETPKSEFGLVFVHGTRCQKSAIS
jgi:hypothetical protein